MNSTKPKIGTLWSKYFSLFLITSPIRYIYEIYFTWHSYLYGDIQKSIFLLLHYFILMLSFHLMYSFLFSHSGSHLFLSIKVYHTILKTASPSWNVSTHICILEFLVVHFYTTVQLFMDPLFNYSAILTLHPRFYWNFQILLLDCLLPSTLFHVAYLLHTTFLSMRIWYLLVTFLPSLLAQIRSTTWHLRNTNRYLNYWSKSLYIDRKNNDIFVPAEIAAK